MAVDFIALDWETANGSRGSACAVGLVEVRAGAVVDSWSSLMRPPDLYGSFDLRNTAVHGLCAKDVADAPRFEELWPSIEARLLGSTVIAHNAQFDLGVVQDATWGASIGCPRLRYGCTLLLARRHYDLPSYTLDVVAEAAGVRLDRHHDALSDALAAAEILLAITQDVGADSVEEVFEVHGLTLGWSRDPDGRPCRVQGRSRWERTAVGEIGSVAPTLW
ncbi:exonuclease domain-containing protein [Actinotalea sp. K2]|uniref:exonuclease domain-containing protein n=1 Tax=Actinotalea sp. K2 TaxID=2939438 RepID=UPI002016DC4C|nr:exonuclease domain-containing protein [Actinotalea sp. K2]MCL3859781.1 exonuclease domain-containing protein [Actinotalea sp. K2]